MTLVVASRDQQIVINEVHYDPPDNTVPAEFIELFNQGFEPVDVSGWYFSSGVAYVLPAGTVIQPGQLSADCPGSRHAGAGIRRDFVRALLGRLSSDGEDIDLRDANARLMDHVDYRQGFPWPIAAGGEGPSMELIHPTLDNSLGGSWRASSAPTPGAPNGVFATNAPPQIRQVNHDPQQPQASVATTITARVTDPNGVSEVQLHYQVVLPGHFIPYLLPLPMRDLRRTPDAPREVNPQYTDPANWTTLPMVDDGSGGDVQSGDGIYTAVIPGQQHRTLMRYRIPSRTLWEMQPPFRTKMMRRGISPTSSTTASPNTTAIQPK